MKTSLLLLIYKLTLNGPAPRVASPSQMWGGPWDLPVYTPLHRGMKSPITGLDGVHVSAILEFMGFLYILFGGRKI